MRRVRSLSSAAVFQSTHPSGVRPSTRRLSSRLHWISIHAPQWGATAEVKPLTVAVTNFNPRTPVGCDLSPPLIRRCRRYFNPRTPVGCDLRLTEQRERTITYFNPRTPVGCDCSISAGRSRFGYFNPRTPVGCDHVRLQAIGTAYKFQSTHPSGVRPTVGHKQQSIPRFQSTHPSGVRRPSRVPCRRRPRYFNPRTPVGCDRQKRRSPA